jgi:hypothetical protein
MTAKPVILRVVESKVKHRRCHSRPLDPILIPFQFIYDILANFTLRNRVGLWNHHAAYVPRPPLFNFWTTWLTFANAFTYITPLDATSISHFSVFYSLIIWAKVAQYNGWRPTRHGRSRGFSIQHFLQIWACSWPAVTSTEWGLLGVYLPSSVRLYGMMFNCEPITEAARSRAWTISARSNTWDRGFDSHSRHGCLCAFMLFCV